MAKRKQKSFLYREGLTLAFLLLFLFSFVGHLLTGRKQFNEFLIEHGQPVISLLNYLTSGYFLQSTFENWESEFLQMALFVVTSIFLYQKGSSESKDPDKKEEVDREPNPRRKNVPWPVKQGGLVLTLYEHSLSIALFLLFILSFVFHWLGSLKDYNEEQMLKNMPHETASQYLSNSRLWFESFQNWQSEFLSVFAIIVLSIFLRQKGSPQSKPVDAPNSETGE